MRPSPRSPDREGTLTGFAPILVANLLPLVGVVRLGWDPATLVVVYWLEVVFSIALAGGKALFAGRPPPEEQNGFLSVSSAHLLDKRGSFRPVEWLPPIYLRNVPFAVRVTSAIVWLSIVFVAFLSQVVRFEAVLARPEVLAIAVSLFAGQLLETRRDYVGDRAYERVSPYAVVETPARQAFFLLFVVVAVSSLAEAAADATVVLVPIVLAKVLLEWATYRATHGSGSARFTDWLAGPDEADDPDEASRSIDPPAAEPSARVRSDPSAALLHGTFREGVRYAPFYVPYFFFGWLLTVILAGEWTSTWTGLLASVVAFGGLFLLAIGISVAGYALRYAPLEYQRRGDQLVAYDTLLEEPQWTTSVRAIREATTVDDRLADRLCGTRTVRATIGWGSEKTDRDLGPVADPDRLVEAFDLPLEPTDPAPIDRTVAVGAVALGVVIVGVAVALSPLHAAFLAPFLVFVPKAVWNRAYENGE